MARTLVIGASGTVGSELSKLLKEQGHFVQATTSKSPRGPEQIQLDLATGKGIGETFDGIERAFLLSPSGFADQYKILSPLIQEAKRRAVRKVVLMSAMGVDANDAAPLRRAEIELENSGLPYNIIRPNWFMQNFNTFWAQGIREKGKILLPAKNAKVSFVDTRDIAAVAAKILVSDDLNNQAFTLTGPEAINHHQVAAQISKVSGKKIIYEEIEPAALKKGLLAAGLPEDYVDFLLLIVGYLAEGFNAAVTEDVKRILGREPIPFAKYAEDFKTSWL